jgi:nitrogen fixation NifU-like protein
MGNTFYNEILTDHNMNPIHKKKIENPTITLEGVNPSCGDDIILSLVVSDGVVTDGGFEGDGCAISQASCDIMLDLCIGKSVDEAQRLAEIFIRMITGKITEEEKEELEEAQILEDISHMPARTKCAVLGWHTMQEMLEEE